MRIARSFAMRIALAIALIGPLPAAAGPAVPGALAPRMVAQTSCAGRPVPSPTIVGRYTDNYGNTHLIAPNSWLMPTPPPVLLFNYCRVNNASQVIIAQNGPNNAYFPNLYSQFNWTMFGNGLFYCQIVYNAPTEAAAAAVAPANPQNPPRSGCGNFPWTQLFLTPVRKTLHHGGTAARYS
jgi:hypothetical protein